ncbi:MAG: AAA family ATPase [Nanoarchaeota archaeon]
MSLCLVLIGHSGCGKDTFVDYALSKYNLPSIKYSTVIAEVAQELGIKVDAPTLKIKQQLWGPILRKQYGTISYVKRMAEKVKGKNYIVNGSRAHEEIDLLQQELGKDVVFIGILADFEVRFSRVQNREADFAFKTVEDFKTSEARESESQIDGMLKKCDHTLTNNTSVEAFQKELDELLSKLGVK